MVKGTKDLEQGTLPTRTYATSASESPVSHHPLQEQILYKIDSLTFPPIEVSIKVSDWRSPGHMPTYLLAIEAEQLSSGFNLVKARVIMWEFPNIKRKFRVID